MDSSQDQTSEHLEDLQDLDKLYANLIPFTEGTSSALDEDLLSIELDAAFENLRLDGDVNIQSSEELPASNDGEGGELKVYKDDYMPGYPPREPGECCKRVNGYIVPQRTSLCAPTVPVYFWLIQIFSDRRDQSCSKRRFKPNTQLEAQRTQR